MIRLPVTFMGQQAVDNARRAKEHPLCEGPGHLLYKLSASLGQVDPEVGCRECERVGYCVVSFRADEEKT